MTAVVARLQIDKLEVTGRARSGGAVGVLVVGVQGYGSARYYGLRCVLHGPQNTSEGGLGVGRSHEENREQERDPSHFLCVKNTRS